MAHTAHQTGVVQKGRRLLKRGLCLYVPLVWVLSSCALLEPHHADDDTFPDAGTLQQMHDVTHADQHDTSVLTTEILPLLKQAHVHTFSKSQLLPENVWQTLSEVDPHASVLSRVSYQSLLHFAADNLVGVGLELHYHPYQQKKMLKRGAWRVRYQPNLPAHVQSQQSLPEGMEVIGIDGQSLAGFDANQEAQVNRLLLGKIDSTVQLTVINPFNKSQHITLQRKPAVASDVTMQVVDDVAVIKVPSFVFNTAEQVSQALSGYQEAHQSSPLKGIIIDLRDNPGGVMDAAQETGMLFSANTPLVEMYRHHSNIVLKTYRYKKSLLKKLGLSKRLYKQLQTLPLVILVNDRTASAAEVFASGFQLAGRAKLYGQRTYGKGSVQQILPLSDGRAFRFTVANYLTMSGQKIDGVGITPEYEMEIASLKSDEDLKGFIGQVFSVLKEE